MRWSAVPAGAKLTYISALIRRFMRHHLLLHARDETQPGGWYQIRGVLLQ